MLIYYHFKAAHIFAHFKQKIGGTTALWWVEEKAISNILTQGSLILVYISFQLSIVLLKKSFFDFHLLIEELFLKIIIMVLIILKCLNINTHATHFCCLSYCRSAEKDTMLFSASETTACSVCQGVF